MNELIFDACDLTLKHPNFINDFIHLTLNEVSLSLGKQNIGEEEISKLLETASLFALNKEPIYQKLAFKISVFLLKQYKDKYPNLPVAVEIIMARLGDLPTIRVMVKNQDGQDYFSYFTEGQDYDLLNMYLKFPEILVTKLTNQVKVTEEKFLTLTDSQAKVYSMLREKPSVAFSAPTSAGKSYVIHNYIAEKMLKSHEFCAIYVAPTKALIAEIQDKISRAITDLGVRYSEFAVFNSLTYLNAPQVKSTPKKAFVLTQERLQDAIANHYLSNVNLLIVDEAHKISDKDRGIIVEDAVAELISQNPGIQTIFISPYIRDPDRFKLIFGVPTDISSEITSKSPVGQNIYRVDFKGKKVTVSLISSEVKPLDGSKFIPLGEIVAESDISSNVRKKAWVAKHLVSEREPTLIYCNTRDHCRKVAKYIAEGTTELEVSEELKKAIKFFSEHVHEEYYLCDSLKNKIGYHYGKMPQFVRFYVKKLFEEKEITWLCCTSTLLEGVNMPAKNIVLHNPKAGTLQMNRLSILNLAGRAGRLLEDYYGKIYCINLKEWDEGEDIFDDKLEKIESAAETTLEKDADSLNAYLKDENLSVSENVKALANSLLMKQLMDPNSSFLMKFKERHHQISEEDLYKIKELLDMISTQLFLDSKVILKNRTIDPRFQNNLYLNLKNAYFETAPSPHDQDFVRKLKFIFQKISQFLLKEGNERYRYFTGLAWQWVSEIQYKTLIDDKIKYQLKNCGVRIDYNDKTEFKAFVNEMIDDLDDDLETKIKYDYTRGLKCYIDIIDEIMKQKGDKRYVCRELPTYLEAGASRENVLFLLDIGFSRSTAILIGPIMDIKIRNISDCIDWLKKNESRIKAHLSEVLYREVEALLNKYKEK